MKGFKTRGFAFTVFFLSTTAIFALPGEFKVAVVLSSDLKEYDQALNGIIHCADWSEARVHIHTIDFDVPKSIEVLQRLVRLHPDLIFTIGTPATRAISKNIKDIPIVYCMVFERTIQDDFKKNGNANVFGIDSYFPVTNQLKALKTVLPEKSRIGILYDPENSRGLIEEALQGAKEYRLNLIPEEVSSKSEVLSSLERIKGDIDVLLGIPDKTIYSPYQMKGIILFSLRNKIPFVGLSHQTVSSGALFSLFCNYSDLGCQAVRLGTEILKGKKFPKFYVESPRNQFLAINLRTAEVINVKLSEDVIKQAMMLYGLEESR